MSTRLVLAPRALTECLLQADAPVTAAETLPLLQSVLALLRQHPLIGRKVEHGLRELVISHDRTGYVALYDYDAGRHMAIVLAARHQREGDYAD
ncbi:type II toxin-antitoxin system RelE/ParE family toxin [Methyloversatilis sp. XJ19-13]|uniref:type II toxin-antitoxin system RelE/ParE family toxin n=1 Tax=Methyloversatilis sp. XJ19-13 TaxID=2963430 RepID=UPI00211BB47F|nr:type II toxin-antitoxin system RelE/ParE family toxin [Methyloversatilis sp. XJ19-13]MCQ9375491.1 type II toxin-antitoxin system RelE/ParE family toxin [Methyloversatilis sp. XJ19-13]